MITDLDLRFLRRLVEIDSPSGHTAEAAAFVVEELRSLGYSPEFTNKGAVRCALGPDPRLALAAHIDTLGAMVSGIRPDGHLRLTQVGGLSLNGYENEYCRIRTIDGRVYTGTLLIIDPSAHANKDTPKKERTTDSMYIRLDEEVTSKAETEQLGIRNGDVIAFDTRYQMTPSGYIKGRHMDNKAGCLVLIEVAKQIAASGRKVPVELFFSTYEEVGHGGTVGYSSTVEELLVIDMGVVGEACEGSESACSICAKDSSGPYDAGMFKRLVTLAEKHKIAYRRDVYPFYGSDGSAALRAGLDLRVGLIGPGVHASHGMERTHRKGIEATIELCMSIIG